MKSIIAFLGAVLILSGCQANPSFQAERAFIHLTNQTEIGPRTPNSPEIEICREYIINTLEKANAKISRQNFDTAISDSVYHSSNIIAQFFPRQPRRILLAAHYDTRPWADKDENPQNHNSPIDGANDAASGVAVLLEIATLLDQQQPPEFGIDLVFFDLEDMGEYGSNEDWCHGSRYFANNLPIRIPEKAIVVDMVGDKDLQIEMEYFSYHDAPTLVNEIWGIAQEHDVKQFKRKIGNRIYDDHMPLLEAGINTIDIIDFEYPHWHTLQDTADKCSPQSLAAVGKVLIELIYKK